MEEDRPNRVGGLRGKGGGREGGKERWRREAYPVHRVSALLVLQCRHLRSYTPQTSPDKRERVNTMNSNHRDMRNRTAHFDHLFPVLGWIHGWFCQQYL